MKLELLSFFREVASITVKVDLARFSTRTSSFPVPLLLLLASANPKIGPAQLVGHARYDSYD